MATQVRPGSPQPERRSRVGGWPIAIVGMVLVLLAYELRYTLIPFVFAGAIGFVLDPVLEWSASRMGGRRWPMAVLLTLMIVALVLGGGYWVAMQSIAELTAGVHKLPGLIQGAVRLFAGPGGIDLFGKHLTPEQASAAAIGAAASLFNAAQIFLVLQIGAGTVAGVILTLVLIPYFLVSGPRIARGTMWLVPPERRHSLEAMLPVLVPVLRRYAVGLACVVVYTATVAYVGLGPIFHVQGAPLLALIVGVLELIPVVGPVTSIALIGLAALQQSGFAAIFLMGWALALRLSIDNLVGPLALGRAASVHPVVVIFAFVIGAMLFGVIGLLLTVPVAATIRLVLEHYYAEPIAPGGEAEPETVRVARAMPGRAGRNRR